MNQWTVSGNLTTDTELRFTTNGTPVLNGCIACNEYGPKDENGKTKIYTEYVHFVIFGALAETQAKWMTKGRPMNLRGRANTESWEKDGIKHYRTKLLVSDIEYVNGQRRSRSDNDNTFTPNDDVQPDEKPPKNTLLSNLFNTDDDLPF